MRKRLLLLALILAAGAAGYLLWRLLQDQHPDVDGRKPHHWPGVEGPVYYATEEERRRYRD